MIIKRIMGLFAAMLLVFVFAGCSEKYNLDTPIGKFNMTVEIAEQYENSLPADGNQFLVVTLEPQTEITVKQMQDYFKPNAANKGAIAECGAGEYTFSSMRFIPGKSSEICVIIFEMPEGLTESDKISLKLPKQK